MVAEVGTSDAFSRSANLGVVHIVVLINPLKMVIVVFGGDLEAGEAWITTDCGVFH